MASVPFAIRLPLGEPGRGAQARPAPRATVVDAVAVAFGLAAFYLHCVRPGVAARRSAGAAAAPPAPPRGLALRTGRGEPPRRSASRPRRRARARPRRAPPAPLPPPSGSSRG